MHFFPFHKTPHDRPEQLTTDSPHTDAEGRSTAGSDVAAHTALKQKRKYGLAQKREQPCAKTAAALRTKKQGGRHRILP